MKRAKSNRQKKDKIVLRTATGITILGALALGLGVYDISNEKLPDHGVRFTQASVQPTINYIHNHSIGKTSNPIEQSEIEILKQQADSVEDRLTILLAGVDSRDDKVEGRSDAMIVLSIDKKKGTLDMVSIPRDSYVPIIGHGTSSKITHAFAYGGRQMMQDTVENMLDMQIDHYAVFNFTSVMGVIDEIGGIEVKVPFDFTEQDSKGHMGVMKFKKGVHTLNGEEALAYARMRKQDAEGDVGRAKRQQQVIEATLDKLTTLNSVKNFKDIYKTVHTSIETDVNFKGLLGLIPYLQKYKVENHVLDGNGVRIGGVYYMQVDPASLEDVKTELKGKTKDE